MEVHVPHADNRAARLLWLHGYRLSFTLKSWTSRESCIWVVCQAFTWSKPLTCDIQSSKSVWMHSFEIYGEWLVQTNKPTNQQAYTRSQCCHASIGLAQARSNYFMYTYIGSQTWPYNSYSYKTLGWGRKGRSPYMGDCYTPSCALLQKKCSF